MPGINLYADNTTPELKVQGSSQKRGQMTVRARGLTELTNREILTSRNVKEVIPSA